MEKPFFFHVQKKTGFVGGLLLHTNDAENPVEAEAVYEYYTFTSSSSLTKHAAYFLLVVCTALTLPLQ